MRFSHHREYTHTKGPVVDRPFHLPSKMSGLYAVGVGSVVFATYASLPASTAAFAASVWF